MMERRTKMKRKMKKKERRTIMKMKMKTMTKGEIEKKIIIKQFGIFVQ